MRILVIAPLPTSDSDLPLSGNALPIKVLVENLRKAHEVEVIDLSKKGYESGFNFGRVFQILGILWHIFKAQFGKDRIYLTVAESLQGNIRDMLIYIICYPKLSKTIIHMLGGNEMKNILSPKNGIQYRINRFFIKKLKGVVVEGQAQKDTFSNGTSLDKIHIIPNFAEDFLINTETNIIAKFSNTNPLRVLFLSNMLYGKGHFELLESYLSLETSIRKKLLLDYAGGFESEEDKNVFLSKIEGQQGVTYHGSVKGEVKKNLFQQAHVFCLPTYYPFEGQPFSIIEAFAAGCCVITTNHSGIRYIFKDEKNGFEVEKKSIESLKAVLIRAINEKDNLLQYGLNNLQETKEKYTQQQFIDSVLQVL
jgi:glycosyltransferase involved in cell wall biosynthesis